MKTIACTILVTLLRSTLLLHSINLIGKGKKEKEKKKEKKNNASSEISTKRGNDCKISRLSLYYIRIPFWNWHSEISTSTDSILYSTLAWKIEENRRNIFIPWLRYHCDHTSNFLTFDWNEKLQSGWILFKIEIRNIYFKKEFNYENNILEVIFSKNDTTRSLRNR